MSSAGGDGNFWLPNVRTVGYFELGEGAALGRGDPCCHHDLLQPQVVLEALLPHALLQLRPQLPVDQRLQLGRRHLRLRAGGHGHRGGRGGGGPTAAAAVGAGGGSGGWRA